jgi:hypothetical protein
MIRGAAIAGIFLLGTVPPMNASPGSPGSRCVAKVLKAEEFAYAPMGYWLVRVTFDISLLRLAVGQLKRPSKIRCRGRELRLAQARRSDFGAAGFCV